MAKDEKNLGSCERQVGGRHYLRYKIQPIVWSMDNHINAAEFSVLKYLLRYRDKNGLEDLDKAEHYSQILMCRNFVPSNQDAIDSIGSFCAQNQLPPYETAGLEALFNQDYIELGRVIKVMKSNCKTGLKT